MQDTELLQEIERLEEENRRLKEIVGPEMVALVVQHEDGQHNSVADLEEKLKESEEVVRLLQEQLDSLHLQTHPKTVFTDEVQLYREQADHYATLYSDLKDAFEKRQKEFEDREVDLSEMMLLRMRLDGVNKKLEDMQQDAFRKEGELQQQKADYDKLCSVYQATKSEVEALQQGNQHLLVLQGQVVKKDGSTTMNCNVKEELEHPFAPQQRRGSSAHQKTEETKKRELFKLRTCVESLQNSLKIKKEEIKALFEELQEGEKGKRELEIQLENATSEIKRLSEEVSNQAADIQHLEKIQMAMADENECQAKDIAAYQTTLRQKELAIETSLQAAKCDDCGALKDSLALLQDQLVEREAQIKTMEASLEHRAREVDSKDREMRLWKEKLRTLQKEKDDIESEAELIVSKQRKEIALLEAKLSANTVQTAQSFAGTEGETHQLTIRLAQAMSDIQAKKSKIVVLENQLQEATQNNIQLETLVNKMREKSAAEGTTFVGLSSDGATHRETRIDVEDTSGTHIMEQAAVAQDYHAKLLESNTKVWALMNECAELHSKLEQCECQLQKKTAALDNSEMRNRTLEKRYAEYLQQEKQKVAALETELQCLSKNLRGHFDVAHQLERNLHTTPFSPIGPAQQSPQSTRQLFSREPNLPPVVTKHKVEPPTPQQIQGMMSRAPFQYAASDPYGGSYQGMMSQPSHHTEQRTHPTRAGLHRNRPAPYDTEIPGSTEV